MTRFHFSDAARSILLSLGWTDSRIVDIKEVVAKLAQRGYTPHEMAIGILESFLGLAIEATGSHSVFFTNPGMVGGMFVKEQIVELHSELFADLYPIGTDSLCCIFVNRNGAVFFIATDRSCWGSYESIERMMDVVLGIDKPTPEEKYKVLRP